MAKNKKLSRQFRFSRNLNLRPILFNYVVNFELVTNLGTAWELLAASRPILVAMMTVSVAISSPA